MPACFSVGLYDVLYLFGFCLLPCFYKIQQLGWSCSFPGCLLDFGALVQTPCSPRLHVCPFSQHLGCCGKVLILGRGQGCFFFPNSCLPRNNRPIPVCLRVQRCKHVGAFPRSSLVSSWSSGCRSGAAGSLWSVCVSCLAACTVHFSSSWVKGFYYA